MKCHRCTVIWLVLLMLIPSSIPAIPVSAHGPERNSRSLVNKVVLGEYFSDTLSSACIDTDAGMDMLIDDEAYFYDRVVIVEYRIDDDYAIPEGDERATYNWITETPTFVVDGVSKQVGSSGTPSENKAKYEQMIDERPLSSYVSLNVGFSIDGSNGSFNITAKVEETIPFSYRQLSLYGALVEDQDVAIDDGHVLRMTAVDMPINGQSVSIRRTDDSYTIMDSMTLDPVWMVQDLALVVWLQSGNTKEVLQAIIGYPDIQGNTAKNLPPTYVGGDLDFVMEEDGVDDHIYLDEVFDDPDKDTLAFGAQPSHNIDVSIDENDFLIVDPATDWSGIETINISAKDATHPPVSAQVSVTVTSVNDPPRITGHLSGLEIDEDSSSITSPLSDLFKDPDGDQLSFMIENTVHLKVGKNQDDSLSIEPLPDWNGFEDLVVKASDGEYETMYQDQVKVNPINDGPIITDVDPPTWLEVEEGGLLKLSVVVKDIENDIITYTWEIDGRGEPINSSSFNYEPDYGDSGDHTVLVKVSDGADITSHAFHFSVIEGNRAPTVRITDPLADQGFDEGDPVVFMCEAHDPDDPAGRTLEYYWTIDGQFLSNEPTFTYRPKKGVHTISLEVTDGEFKAHDMIDIKVREKGGNIPGFEAMTFLMAAGVAGLIWSLRKLEGFAQ